MGSLILFLFYGSILFFVIAAALRIARVVGVPLHLHWELYSGSSMYEFSEWWTKPHSGPWNKAGTMLLDVLFLREFFRRNRRFWWPLYAFHLGLYLLITWHAWLFLRAVVGSPESASSFGWAWGTFATLLAFVGGAGVLFKRMTDRELNVYYPPIHYVKWIFILLTLFGGFLSVDIHFQSSMPELLKYVRGQVTFQDWEHKLHPAALPALHVLFASGWLILLPFSHLFQLFFRYYHVLKWDDVPNHRGGPIEKSLEKLLERPVTWSAGHIQQGETWTKVASEVPQPPGAEGRQAR
jgi:nitrate reductase gamma subunit